jgi:hypothetical protein
MSNFIFSPCEVIDAEEALKDAIPVGNYQHLPAFAAHRDSALWSLQAYKL